jgi:hypothetical protein
VLRARMIGRVVAVDSTHIEAYSGRAVDNASGKSDPDARAMGGIPLLPPDLAQLVTIHISLV